MNEEGAVIIENNIFASLCQLSKKSPADFVGLSGNGNKTFTGERHVQNEYNPRSPRSQTNSQRLSSPSQLFSCYYLPLIIRRPTTFKNQCPLALKPVLAILIAPV
jgi:hypothetical protein